MDLKTIPLYFAVAFAGIIAFEYATVIFTGGVGKNGSTVAVSKQNKKYSYFFYVVTQTITKTYFIFLIEKRVITCLSSKNVMS